MFESPVESSLYPFWGATRTATGSHMSVRPVFLKPVSTCQKLVATFWVQWVGVTELHKDNCLPQQGNWQLHGFYNKLYLLQCNLLGASWERLTSTRVRLHTVTRWGRSGGQDLEALGLVNYSKPSTHLFPASSKYLRLMKQCMWWRAQTGWQSERTDIREKVNYLPG